MGMNTTDAIIQEFNITLPSDRLNEMHNRITVLNRKAAKYGINPIKATLGTETIRELEDGEKILVTPVCIKFEPIVIAGNWTFKASIEHELINDEYKNVISGYNLSHEDEVKYRCINSKCDHCQVKRHRNLTYVVKSADGETKQVGSTCLKDYLGVPVEAAIASLNIMSELSEMDDEESGYGRSVYRVRLHSLKDVISTAMAVIQEFGFISRAKAEVLMRSTTANFVQMELNPPTPQYKRRIFPNADHEKIADVIISRWNATLMPKFEGNSDELDSFQFKVAMTVALGVVKPNLFSTVVASAHHEYMVMQEEKNPKKADLNEFIPGANIKDKITVDLIVKKITKIDGEYGVTSVMNFRDAEGRKVVWFASGALDEKEWEIGSTVKVKGTVKNLQDDPRFGKQTILTRVKKQ